MSDEIASLREITVYGGAEYGMSSWADCATGSMGAQQYAFGLGYLQDDSVLDDFARAITNMAPIDRVPYFRYVCEIAELVLHNHATAYPLFFEIAKTTTPYSGTFRLDGSVWSIFKAAGHYFWGNGWNMYVEQKALNIKYNTDTIGLGGTNPLSNFIAATKSPGTYDYVSGPYVYYSYANSGFGTSLTVGNIILDTVGRLTVNGDGSWFFEANTWAYPDRFDTNMGPVRPWWGDLLTQVASVIGGSDFTVVIEGPEYIQLRGR